MKTYVYIFILCLTSVHSRVADLKTDDELLSDPLKVSIKVELDNELDNKIAAPVNKILDKVQDTPGSSTPCHSSHDVDNNIDVEENRPCVDKVEEGNGTALILTPLIEQGRTAEARNASWVDPSVFLGFESYSGFLTVNSTYNSNTFFWYFPVVNKSREETPWIIWLQGGPGASSMTGVFDEIGPFTVKNGTLIPNHYTWIQNHSIVFIENPVGTGFSFTEHKDGFVRDLPTYSKHLHTAVKQLVQLFPELKVAPLFVAGESYAGKYVPALGLELHKHISDTSVNLKGFIIGNAFVEPKMISQIVQPFYHFGLLEKEQIELVKPFYEHFQQDILNNRSVEAKQKWGLLVVMLLNLSYQQHAYNFLADEMMAGTYSSFLKKAEVKRALHVGDINFEFVNVTVNSVMAPDFLSSTKPHFEELLNHYKVLAYCGQLDQMLPCALTAESYRTWRWNNSDKFLKSHRYPYIFNSKLAGYFKSGGGLTWVVVRGAGHMVPADAPGPARDLVSRWTRGAPLPPMPLQMTPPELMFQFIRSINTTVYL